MPALIDNEPNSVIEPNIAIPADAAIAVLAYQLWEDRGRPIGSPQEDWFIAERELTNHSRYETVD